MNLKLKEEVALPPSIENVMENYSRLNASWFSLLPISKQKDFLDYFINFGV
jgi:hypothetical protein